jgi:hypothetical protein
MSLGRHRNAFMRGFSAQNCRDHRVNGLDPPRVDLALHRIILADHLGTSFFAVQKIAFISIRWKFSSLKSSGCPSDV